MVNIHLINQISFLVDSVRERVDDGESSEQGSKQQDSEEEEEEQKSSKRKIIVPKRSVRKT